MFFSRLLLLLNFHHLPFVFVLVMCCWSRHQLLCLFRFLFFFSTTVCLCYSVMLFCVIWHVPVIFLSFHFPVSLQLLQRHKHIQYLPFDGNPNGRFAKGFNTLILSLLSSAFAFFFASYFPFLLCLWFVFFFAIWSLFMRIGVQKVFWSKPSWSGVLDTFGDSFRSDCSFSSPFLLSPSVRWGSVDFVSAPLPPLPLRPPLYPLITSFQTLCASSDIAKRGLEN